MKVLVLLAIFALAAAKQSQKGVIEQSTQVADKSSQKYLPAQPSWQQYLPPQYQQFVSEQKEPQAVPEQKVQQFVPQQFYPVPEQKVQQFVPQQFNPVPEQKVQQFVPQQFYPVPEQKVQQYAPQQFYPQQYYPQQYLPQAENSQFVAYPYQQEQFVEQFPVNWKVSAPKTAQYQVDYKPEEQFQYLPYSPKNQFGAQVVPRPQGFEYYGSQYPSTYQYGPYQQGYYGVNYNQLNKPYQQAYPAY